MSWESRNGRGRYYTRSKRVNGRIVREYLGSGPVAEIVAAQDAESRAERLEERLARIAAKEEIKAAEALVERCRKRVAGVTGVALLSAGFHRHHRGKWRKHRV